MVIRKQKVLIRVDGNSQIGLGHIYRSIALAEMLKDEFEIEFISKSDSTINPIQDADFKHIFLPDNVILLKEPLWFRENYSADTIIVLDGYDFTETYQRKIKEFNFKLVYIDDLAKGFQKADLVINHSPGIKESDYKADPYTKFALGLNYPLLRKPFIEAARKDINLHKDINNVFVSFGGADIHDFSFAAVNALSKLEYIKEINVVVGAAYKHDAIFKLQDSKIRIHKNISSNKVFTIMKNADWAVVPASTISIELASLGVPMILGYSIDNQKSIYKGFVDKKVVIGVGSFNEFHFKNLCKIISSKSDLEFLRESKEKLLDLFSSNIKLNYLRLFEFNDLRIRRAISTDMEFVFALSNETLVRANSYNSEKIDLGNHKIWYDRQQKSKDVLFCIIENNVERVGQVRFTIKEKHSVIGISISKAQRGKGYASESLKLAAEEYFNTNKLPIYAYTKKSNIASVKSFEKAGFVYFKDEVVEGVDSFIYIKERQ